MANVRECSVAVCDVAKLSHLFVKIPVRYNNTVVSMRLPPLSI